MTDFRTCPACAATEPACLTCDGTGLRPATLEALQLARTAEQWTRALIDELVADWRSVIKVAMPSGKPGWALRDEDIRITWDGRPTVITLPAAWLQLSREERLERMREHHQRAQIEKTQKAHADRRRALEDRKSRLGRELHAIEQEAIALAAAEAELFPVHQQKEMDPMTTTHTPLDDAQIVQDVIDGKLPKAALFAGVNDPRQPVNLTDAWSYAQLRGLSNEAFFAERGITDRDSYIAHRDALKRALRLTAAYQKGLSLRTRQRGGDSDAQWRKFAMKPEITRLIEIRRAGKVWSAEAAKKRKAAA